MRRSLITLKALTYAPTGGICAAPTTSLPEKIGGARNWDYRFCWLRDATFTLDALLDSGFEREAEAWSMWLRRAVAGSPDRLQIMYGLDGRRRLPELILDWLPGYEGSTPVRTGNAAHQQFQLDVYGEVLDMLHTLVCQGRTLRPDSWSLAEFLVEHVAKTWTEPDDGIWEVRGPQASLRALQGHGLGGHRPLDQADRPRRPGRAGGTVVELRDQIHADVCTRGVDAERGCFVQYYGSTEVDASC